MSVYPAYGKDNEPFVGKVREETPGDKYLQTIIKDYDAIQPSHYNKYKITPLEFILANEIPFCESNAIKYLCRWKDKGGIEDLRKAIEYIEQLIAHNEKG